jgi:hypothetical protein
MEERCRDDAVVLGVRPIERTDVVAFCERVRALLEDNDVPAVLCDVRDVTVPDMVMVDALSRLVLIGRQLGRSVEFRHVSPGLRGLFDLVGLGDVVCEGERQAEEGEELLGVEEVVDAGDLVAGDLEDEE